MIGVHPLRALVVAVSTAAVWLLLAGTIRVVEVVVAGVVGAVAAWGGQRLRRYVGHQHRGGARWACHLPRMIVRSYVDCWTVTLALARRIAGRPIHGRFRVVPFRHGSDDGEDVGRRVLTVVGVTLQPNSYVVGFDRDRSTVLVHELVPSVDGPVPSELREAP